MGGARSAARCSHRAATTPGSSGRRACLEGARPFHTAWSPGPVHQRRCQRGALPRQPVRRRPARPRESRFQRCSCCSSHRLIAAEQALSSLSAFALRQSWQAPFPHTTLPAQNLWKSPTQGRGGLSGALCRDEEASARDSLSTGPARAKAGAARTRNRATAVKRTDMAILGNVRLDFDIGPQPSSVSRPLACVLGWRGRSRTDGGSTWTRAARGAQRQQPSLPRRR